jgi:site-specific DNA-methyltransferase (adenine-specific)
VNEYLVGDCLEIMREWPDECVDLIVTDPPYFQPTHTSAGTRESAYKRTLADMSIFKIAFDSICEEFFRILNKTGTIYIFCDANSYPPLYQSTYPYCKNVRSVIWDRVVSYNGYTWRRQHEIILWGELTDTERVPTGDGDVIQERAVPQAERVHPVQKPVPLIKRLIDKSSMENNVICDPFAGSGTTAVACTELNRRWICIDIEPKYKDIALKRLQGATIGLNL